MKFRDETSPDIIKEKITIAHDTLLILPSLIPCEPIEYDQGGNPTRYSEYKYLKKYPKKNIQKISKN